MNPMSFNLIASFASEQAAKDYLKAANRKDYFMDKTTKDDGDVFEIWERRF